MPPSEPIVTHMFTADPRAHVFEGRLYVYPSHDIEAGIPENDEGDHFDMRDCHVLSMDEVGGEVTDHGIALRVEDIPWAGRQLWSNDAAYKDGTYYLYFPLKDRNDVFRIGVARSRSPAASASTPACSATTTARTTCTSAGCGADSFSAGVRGPTTRRCRAIRWTTCRRSALASHAWTTT